jgi:hypothetical protein
LARLYEQAASGAADVSLASITSVFPSSTMPALATLNTGLPPAAHGLMGWTVYLEEFGAPVELARWGPAAVQSGSYADPELGGHDPVTFFATETVHQQLARAGVRSVVIAPAPHKRSGFSRMIFQGAELAAYLATSSILVRAEHLLAGRAAGERLYAYGYWPTVDTLGHRCGPHTAEHAEEVATLDFALGRWLARHDRRGDALFLLTADHGHVASDPARVVRLDLEKALLDELVSLPTGERRLAYLHPRPNRLGAVRRICEDRLADVAELLDSSEAFERGLFGPGPASETARRRTGELILLARGDHQFVCPFSERQKPYALIGNHGALDPREMLVPLLAVRL